jgi:hypothetical protein
MSSFEFFTVLLSFVVSLGVASLLHGVIRLIQEGPRVRFSFAWALWAASIFNVQIVFWLRSWSYHEHFSLRVETSLPPLALAIIAFVACGLATPHIPEEGVVDLREFHAKQGRKYQIAYAAFMVMATVLGLLMREIGSNPSRILPDSISQIVIALIAIAAVVFQRQRWLQIGAPAAFLVSALAYYGPLFEQ